MAEQKWTVRRQRALEAYIKDLAPRLRLADWTIHVVWDDDASVIFQPLPVTNLANIRPYPGSKHATLRVSDLFLTLSPYEQTQTLCHELMHCHLFALSELTATLIRLLTDGEQAVAEPAVSQHVELTVDGLADAFAPLVPLFAVDGPSRASTGPR